MAAVPTLPAGVPGRDPQTVLALCVQRHGGMIKRTAWRITGNEHLAEDVCQAVFLVLARKVTQLMAGQSLAGWLHRVAVLAARGAVKSEARRKRREERVAMAFQTRGQPTTLVPPGLDEAIDRLPDQYRQVIVAHYLEGRRHGEIAADLGVAEETVQKRASRGLERLRRALVPATAGLSVAALASALATEAAAAASATPVVAAAGTAGGAAAGLAGAVEKALLWAKVKVAAAVTGAALAVGTVASVLLLLPTPSFSWRTLKTRLRLQTAGRRFRAGFRSLFRRNWRSMCRRGRANPIPIAGMCPAAWSRVSLFPFRSAFRWMWKSHTNTTM